ncbi:MAG: LOG family protein [Candidatus Peregrinibacteria bacterium]
MKKTKILKPLLLKPGMSHGHYHVAIFGSARIKRDDPRYRQIKRLAKMIARAGFDIVTGGGPGIMEAANWGHQEGRGKNHNHLHSFGLNIKLTRWKQVSNRHLDVKKEFHRFSRRLDYFMRLANAVVVAPGGIGTLLELFYTWQLTQVKQIRHVPIILLGDMWAELFDWIKKWPLHYRLMNKSDLNSIFLARNPREAIKILKKAHQGYKNDADNY